MRREKERGLEERKGKTFLTNYELCYMYLQISQRDILNSIDREMSGDLKAGFKCIGKSSSVSDMF